MSYQQSQQEFNKLIKNQECLVYFRGQQQNIRKLVLSDDLQIIIKDFSTIKYQLKQEFQTLEYLKRELKEQYSDYFPHVYKIDYHQQKIYMEEAQMDFSQYICQLSQSIKEIEMKEYFCQIINCLNQLHIRNIIHGDIKPQNILVFISNSPFRQIQFKLCDFGCSRRVDNEMLTEGFGTKGYIDQKYLYYWNQNTFPYYNGFSSDIFALGMTLFESFNSIKLNQNLLHLISIYNEYVFWYEVNRFYPKTCYWSDQLKQFFLKMVHPDEKQRWKINQLLESEWLGSVYEQYKLKKMKVEERNQLYLALKHYLPQDYGK